MPADLQKARELFLHAVGRLSPEVWDDYVAQACGDEAELAQQVRRFLQVHREAGSFLESPASILPAPLGGEGLGVGMGTVWMAQQTEPVKRLVALKLIKAGMDSKQVIARFEAERQALALMDHPNIAKVFDGGVVGWPFQADAVAPSRPGKADLHPGRPYFVMELVKGVPITKYCDEHHLTPRQRLELFVPVCQAVQHAHQKGIIHRDLKPSNVLVALYDGKPVPKVIDFGVAKAAGQQLTDRTLVTGFGAIVGTLEYMSPEQAEINQLDIDTRSDIYSLGVLLYELLTGSTPFTKKDFEKAGMLEMLRMIREQEPSKPSTKLSKLGSHHAPRDEPGLDTRSETATLASIAANRGTEPAKLTKLVRGELDWIVMKALEKDRNRRYETANGFAMDVQRYLADEAVLACPPSTGYRLRKFARRNKTGLAMAGCVLLVVGALAGSIGWVLRDRAAQQAKIELEETARLGQVEIHARDCLSSAQSLLMANRLSSARQKVAEAHSRLSQDREALPALAAQVDAGLAELDRYQRFFDLIDQAHEAETGGVLALPQSGSRKADELFPGSQNWDRQPRKAVPFLLQALALYRIGQPNDWKVGLEGQLLAEPQLEQIRHAAYEELLWLADDVLRREEDHMSTTQLSAKSAARQALAYLEQAETLRPPTRGFYELRGRCRQALGLEARSEEADGEQVRWTAPSLALDHSLRGQAAFEARDRRAAIKAFQDALQVEPNHYWSLMRLGYCLCDLGEDADDFAAAAAVFSGCILKRPDHAHAYYCRALAYAKLRRHDDAAADCSKAIALDASFAAAWGTRGAAFAALGRSRDALADYSKAVELKPSDANAWSNRGILLMTLNQPQEGLADLTKAIALNKMLSAYRNNRGWAYLALRQPDKALADLNRAVSLDPRNSVAWTNRASAHLAVHQIEDALADCIRAIDTDPKRAQAWSCQGVCYLGMDQPQQALVSLRKATELDPTSAHAWANRAAAHAELTEWTTALAQINKALDLDPKLAMAWINRGRVYLMGLGQPEKAIADFNQALALDGQLVFALDNRGVAYLRMGQPERALADLDQAVAIDARYANAWINRGVAQAALGRPQQALADYSKAIELAPRHAKAWFNRALAHLVVGEIDKGVADHAKASAYDPRYESAWDVGVPPYPGQPENVAELDKAIAAEPKNAALWVRRAIACLQLKDAGKGLAACNQAIALAPTLADAWRVRAEAYHMLRQVAKAPADCAKAIQLDPNSAKAWSTRGGLYTLLRQPEKALADLNKAIELDPQFAPSWSKRGLAYVGLNQIDKAIADYSKALELDPGRAVVWHSRGNAHKRVGQREKALADYSKAIELGGSATAWLYRAQIYADLGQWDKALRDYSAHLEKSPKSPGPWFWRAQAYEKLEMWNQAAADYLKATQLTPNLEWQNHLAWLWVACPDAKVRDAPRALELAKRLVTLEPKQGRYWRTLGVASCRAGDWKAAVAALSHSKDLDTADAADWFFGAIAQRRLGNHAGARAWYEQAVHWLDSNRQVLTNDSQRAAELHRFRGEAEEALELNKK